MLFRYISITKHRFLAVLRLPCRMRLINWGETNILLFMLRREWWSTFKKKKNNVCGGKKENYCDYTGC